MSTIKKDDLFEIFQRNLEQMQTEASADAGISEKLISKTVDEYLSFLFGSGFIPLHFIEPIQEDLQKEVEEMFRKKTYGFFGLQQYLHSQTPSKKRKAKAG